MSGRRLNGIIPSFVCLQNASIINVISITKPDTYKRVIFQGYIISRIRNNLKKCILGDKEHQY